MTVAAHVASSLAVGSCWDTGAERRPRQQP